MDHPDPGPVVQRLIHGAQARTYRRAAGLDLADAARELQMTKDKLSKVENGQLATTPNETERMITRYGILGEAAVEFRNLGRDARRRAAPERVVEHGRQYVALERAATELRMVYAEVPGAFQTTEYALAQLRRSPVVLPSHAEGMAEAREERGDYLKANPDRRVWAILGEESLHREVGGRDVLRRQLERVHAFAELDHVSVRVFPFSAGAAPALSCPFTLLWIEPANARIAYAETLTGSDYFKTTGAFVAAFEQAEGRALSEDDTRSLLERRINDL
ncbi:transcriptional regulator with XRE-family HTH domain [Kibdelosporangium banguiense]|uniref:Transcriptional regulator with XRE-family HTH domain n=1 Tax=Kibdelosporangium banguiense TaxID=1365924 RepID=A0ABS4T5L9_9PSEU|nr:DUF5753 domain-containing protein [Kibdelosporangium banguiense]MBP2319754.1 transcriptional regulator with XRE-family HTH domain [Kibdelosporangium banguiense]